MENKFLLGAIRIGDQLLDTADKDRNGLSWVAADIGKKDGISWTKKEDLYSGTSGIALFLLALYQQTKVAKYLDAAEEAMRWVQWYCNQHKTDYYAFFTGRLGVSYAYIKFYEVTGDKSYLTKASLNAKNSLDFLKNPYAVNDLINGLSGTLLGLIHLHAVLHEDWIMDYIGKYTHALLEHAKFDDKGLYWDPNEYSIRPLCGFSHGSSGIGYVFLELGKYVKNNVFFYVADQAFAYENNYFNKKTENWPDFRIIGNSWKGIAEFEQQYEAGNFKVFTRSHDMCSWCHGAAGIGLSRIRALQLLHNADYEADREHAIRKTLKTSVSSYTLCHGGGGNAELFIEDYLFRKKEDSLIAAKKIAMQAIDQREKTGVYALGLGYDPTKNAEDPSLFQGIAGVGYFLLRVYNPEEVQSLLIPKVTSVNEQSPMSTRFTLSSLKYTLIANMFPKTLQSAKHSEIKKISNYFQRDKVNNSELHAFIDFMTKLISSLPVDKKIHLYELFTLERKKIEISLKRKSSILQYVKERINARKAIKLLQLSDKDLAKQNLHLSSEVDFLRIYDHIYIFKCNPTRTDELQINLFSYTVLYAFSKIKKVKDVCDEMQNTIIPLQNIGKAAIRYKIVEQIKDAIKTGILITSENFNQD